MYKNQLQELAQRSCFNLPSYSCIREGPDHAPRFKATVTFNGEVFESPGYHSTLRQAEHAAAEVALNNLSKRGPTQSLAARILDETGVCKNLLQETAQRAGVSLPVYTTIRSGPKHLPLFKCVVQVGGRNFIGDPAKTKKQAEKNAAMAAWSSLKQMSSTLQTPLLLESQEFDDPPGDRLAIGPSIYGRDDRGKHLNSMAQVQCGSQRSRTRTVNVRDLNRTTRDGYATSSQFYSGAPSVVASDVPNHDRNHNMFVLNKKPPAPGEISYEAGQRYLYNQPGSSQILPDSSFGSARGFYNHAATPGSYGGSSCRQKGPHQRRHSLSGMESPMASHETATTSRASGGGSMLGRTMVYHPQQIRGLPYQSLSERFELNRPSLLEELQQRDEEDEWLRGEATLSSSVCHQQYPRNRWQSQSERFEYRNYHLPQLEEVNGRDEEEWFQTEALTSTSSNIDKDENTDCNRKYKEGWLRGETLLQRLEEQKRHGYKEGWLRADAMKDDKAQSFREGWSHNESLQNSLEEDRRLNLNHGSKHNRSQTHLHGYNDGWIQGETLGSSIEDRPPTHGHAYNNEFQSDKKSVYPPPAAASASSTASGSPSHFASLWSKSTQWWGSRSPISSSSAAAALASSLGLRPASSMAPAVRVRHMVPVCSAPPPRRNEAPGPIQPPRHDHQASSMMDGESSTRHLFSKLRL